MKHAELTKLLTEARQAIGEGESPAWSEAELFCKNTSAKPADAEFKPSAQTPFINLIDLLSDKKLLTPEDTFALLTQTYNPSILFTIVSYFVKANLLANTTNLQACIKLTKKPTNIDLANLFDSLQTAKFNINRNQLLQIIGFSKTNLIRVRQVILELNKSNLLNSENFDKAMQRIAFKLPEVKESIATKNRRKATGLPESEVVLDHGLRFFVEHNDSQQYPGGQFGMVKQGFLKSEDESQEPDLVIKKLRRPADKHCALREVKYHRLLGRQAFYFERKEKTRIVSDWQVGIDLERADDAYLATLPLVKRIHCLHSAFTQLNQLHAVYHVHGDIKPLNLILDEKNSALKLIDFGSAHKYRSAKHFDYTIQFLDIDPATKNYAFATDIFSMHFCVAKLFPDLFSIEVYGDVINVSEKKSPKHTHFEHGVFLLFTSLRKPQTERPTADDIVNYLQKIIDNTANLDSKLLGEIAASTIQRNDTTVEDVLRGCFRKSA